MIRSTVSDRDTAARRHASATVGMVGAGQLARMAHQAAVSLGIHMLVLAASGDDPAVIAGAPARIGSPDDAGALAAFAAEVDVVTFDHEIVPTEHLEALVAAGHRVRPGPQALRMAQDKAHARRVFESAGLPGPAWRQVESVDDVIDFAAAHAWPVVLKAERGGYDGRGVVVADDVAAAAEVLAGGGVWIAEAHVPIARELAVVVARRPGGERVVYPVVETHQRRGMCHEAEMPADVPAGVAAAAVDLAVAVVEAIDGVGVIAVEMFLDTSGRLLINEVALRPHNSGHATIEGSVTSQFENHLRAVLDWPLGDTAMTGPVAAMVNVVGESDGAPLAPLAGALALPGARVHLYGKAARPDRKLGHVTVVGDDRTAVLDAARRAAERLVAPSEGGSDG